MASIDSRRLSIDSTTDFSPCTTSVRALMDSAIPGDFITGEIVLVLELLQVNLY